MYYKYICVGVTKIAKLSMKRDTLTIIFNTFKTDQVISLENNCLTKKWRYNILPSEIQFKYMIPTKKVKDYRINGSISNYKNEK